MSRDMSPAMAEAFAADVMRPIALVEIESASGPIRVWSGVSSLYWNGHEWLGIGAWGSVGQVRENSDIRETGLVFSLSGVDSAGLRDDLGAVRNRDRVRFWFGLLNDVGQVIEDPVMLGNGFADDLDVTDDGRTSVISLRSASRGVKFRRTQPTYYTLVDQTSVHPSDQSLRFVALGRDTQIRWGIN